MANRTDELNRRLGGVETIPARRIPDDPQIIRVQIEQTRTQMGQTIEQLQERLSPERIKQETQEAIRDATIGKVQEMTHKAEYEMKSWPSRVTRTVRENPLPAALIGIGIGWLLVSDRNGESYGRDNDYGHRYYDDNYSSRNRRYQEPRLVHRHDDESRMDHESREWVKDKTNEARERVGAAAEKVQDRASAAVEAVQDRASETTEAAERRAKEFGQQVQTTARETQQHVQDAAEQFETHAREGVRRTKQTFWDMMEENPLIVGTAALAAGAVLGMSLPNTPTEDRLMGERRDHLLEGAKETVQETTRKVQSIAREAQESAVETVKREVDKQTDQNDQDQNDQDNQSYNDFTSQTTTQHTSVNQ
jgi:hypothetical protein